MISLLRSTAAIAACLFILVPCVVAGESDLTNNQPLPPSVPESPAGLQQVIEKLDAFVTSQREMKNLPAVSVALVADSQVVWQNGWGPQDATGSEPATGDTIYRVGSVSKLYTDVVVMMLVHRGLLDLDADIREYLPDFAPENPYGVPITLRLLLSHQSGLVREPPVGHYFDPTEPTIAQTVRSLNQTRLIFKPGTQTKYSNAAITVVGRIVEVVCNKPYQQCIADELLNPLGMADSGFCNSPALSGRLATAWMRTAHRERWEVPTFELATTPAGNLYSSVNDQAKFLAMVCAGGQWQGRQIVPAEIVEQMTQRATFDRKDRHVYGLGFRIGELDGMKTVGHGGAVYGYATQVTAIPEKRMAVIAVTALDGANGFTSRTCDYALRLMVAGQENRPLPDWQSSKATPPQLAETLAGSYRHGDQWIDLYQQQGRLFMRKGFEYRELRCQSVAPLQLVVDDVEGYGPVVSVDEDGSLEIDATQWQRADDPRDGECPPHLQEYIGEYGWDHNTLYIYEHHGQLWALIEWFFYYPLEEVASDRLAFPERSGLYLGEQLHFKRGPNREIIAVEAAGVLFKRRSEPSPSDGPVTPPRKPL